MRGNANRFADKRLDTANARAQLQMELVNATDARFAQLKPNALFHRFRVPLRECECMLLAEQGRRERAEAERVKMQAMC